MVNIHELGFSECPKSYVFKGDRELNAKEVGEQLGLITNPTD